jgi:hypothetical protein
MAAAVRDELLLIFQDANALVRRVVTLDGICAHYGLPLVDGGLVPALGPAVLAAEAAHAAYEEFSAALSVQTGDAGAGASAPVPAEPLKVAA